jgi:hypothetical protein
MLKGKVQVGINHKADSTNALCRGGQARISDEVIVMIMERRGLTILAVITVSTKYQYLFRRNL